jgi:glycosyltransferase involved in cell wall biosynthesis
LPDAPPLTLLILAGGGDRHSFGALLDDDRVVDHGPFAPGDLAELLGGAQVGLSTSVFETFHRVTREYLAGGLAVVGAATFGITDVVVDGVNGVLFDHRRPGSLRQAVLSLLADRPLVDRLRHGARATAVRSVAEEVTDLEGLYRQLLARPATPAPGHQLA